MVLDDPKASLDAGLVLEPEVWVDKVPELRPPLPDSAGAVAMKSEADESRNCYEVNELLIIEISISYIHVRGQRKVRGQKSLGVNKERQKKKARIIAQ